MDDKKKKSWDKTQGIITLMKQINHNRYMFCSISCSTNVTCNGCKFSVIFMLYHEREISSYLMQEGDLSRWANIRQRQRRLWERRKRKKLSYLKICEYKFFSSSAATWVRDKKETFTQRIWWENLRGLRSRASASLCYATLLKREGCNSFCVWTWGWELHVV